MKKFSFDLEKILEFRDFEKKQAEAELAKALSVETEIQNSLNAIASQFASLKNYMKGSLDFSDMVSMSQNTSLLNFQKEELLKQLSQAKIVSEQKRDVLRECMKKTNALEKMKELQLASYKEELKKEESKRLEEISQVKVNADNV